MEKTEVQIAHSKSRSLRTTIPAAFARTLGIEEHTVLGWDLKPNGGGWSLVVRVVPPEEPEKPPKRRGGAKGGRR